MVTSPFGFRFTTAAPTTLPPKNHWISTLPAGNIGIPISPQGCPVVNQFLSLKNGSVEFHVYILFGSESYHLGQQGHGDPLGQTQVITGSYSGQSYYLGRNTNIILLMLFLEHFVGSYFTEDRPAKWFYPGRKSCQDSSRILKRSCGNF